MNAKTRDKIPGSDTGIEIKKTICSICNPLTHCGVNAYVKEGTVIKIEGMAEHPHSGGSLCSKGAANRQYIYHQDRIHTPLLRVGERGTGSYVPISWDEAYETIAERFSEIKGQSGPESVVFFSGFSKWMRPFLKRLAHNFGSPNYTTESSFCFHAMVMAHILTYGDFAGPDMEHAKCLLVWGVNPFHSETPDARHYLQAKENGVKIIDVGPFITPMTAIADIHLRLRPGTDGALALAMAHVIIKEDLHDSAFIEQWSLGFESYKAYVEEYTPAVAEAITGVPATKIIAAARLYATTKPAAMINSGATTVHHTNGIQNSRAITALLGLTGNFDRKGGNCVTPSSYYHVPTGLSTREEEFQQVRPWHEMAPRVGDDRFSVWSRLSDEAKGSHLPFQIQSQQPYPIKAMLAFGLNYRMWPGSDFMLKSLKQLDFIVDVDLFMTDSARLADIILPACSSFERSELKIWPERYAMWTRPVIKPIGEARSDVDIILELSSRLGLEDNLFDRGHEACMEWIFKPSGVDISVLKDNPGGMFLDNTETTPYLKYEDGGFPTPSGKMEFTSLVLKELGFDPLPVYTEPEMSPISTPGIARKFPLVLNTGSRLPMFIHSRTFRLAWTAELRKGPMVDIHPKDAEVRGLQQGDKVALSTPRGTLHVLANLTMSIMPGVVSMYHAYPQADVNTLIAPEYLDPISGFAGFKSLLCQLSRI